MVSKIYRIKDKTVVDVLNNCSNQNNHWSEPSLHLLLISCVLSP